MQNTAWPDKFLYKIDLKETNSKTKVKQFKDKKLVLYLQSFRLEIK